MTRMARMPVTRMDFGRIVGRTVGPAGSEVPAPLGRARIMIQFEVSVGYHFRHWHPLAHWPILLSWNVHTILNLVLTRILKDRELEEHHHWHHHV